MKCPCGEPLIGDGYTMAIHCPNAEVDFLEPDAEVVYCSSGIEEEKKDPS